MIQSKAAQNDAGGDRPFHDLAGFARLYLGTRSVRHHKDIHTEDLAEAFRLHMCLPPFPTLPRLTLLCDYLKIELGELPRGSSLPAANTTYDSQHAILMRPNLPTLFAESSMGHELREVIERAFQQADPSYQGLDTSDNQKMHGESEHFALCLLMQAEATHQRLFEIGFDLVRFAAERERSLPSVLMRARNIYGGLDAKPGPHSGLWIFDGPSKGGVTPANLKVKHEASLCGFSRDKSGSTYAKRSNVVFPRRGATAECYNVVRVALERRQPALEELSLNDLFGDGNYVVVAEPIIIRAEPRRIGMTAVRRDCLAMVEPLLRRLGLWAAVSAN